METNLKQQEEFVNKITRGVLKKFPLLGATISKLSFISDEKFNTAATDGEKIYYSAKFINKLTYEEQIFIFSHEVMHVAFDHIMRSKDRDQKIWNKATDAVINQILINEHLPMVKGGVNITEALDKSAEEVYEALINQEREKASDNNQEQEKQHTREQSKKHNSENKSATNNESIFNEERVADEQSQKNNTLNNDGVGEHEIWQKVVEKAEKNAERESAKSQKENQENKSKIEKNFAKANTKLKEKIANEIKQKLQEQKQSMSMVSTNGGLSFGNVGQEKTIFSWKVLLKREIDKEQDMWSYRRADADNYYQARIESRDVEDFSKTEVLLDTSGSVSNELLRSFLRQLKPLLKESHLFVGCFDHAFYGFQEIKRSDDINSFTIRGRGGTNFDLAIQSFTKKQEINKIIFTDGDDIVANTPENKKQKIVWVVYDNKKFSPPFGKVIHVSSQEIMKYNENSAEKIIH